MASSPLPQPLAFTVRRRLPVLVPPAGPTPWEIKHLSDIDDQGRRGQHGPSRILFWSYRALCCSRIASATFEVLTAFLLYPEDEVRPLCIFDARRRFKSSIPPGYYGNALAYAMARTTDRKPLGICTRVDYENQRSGDQLTENPLAYAPELIMKTKGVVTEEFMKSLVDFLVIKGRPHCNIVRTYVVSNVISVGLGELNFGWESLFTMDQLITPWLDFKKRPHCNMIKTYDVSDVTWVGLGELDFGWGKPVYGGPIKSTVVGFHILFKNKKGEKSIVVPVLLSTNAMKTFARKNEKLKGDESFIKSSL